MENNEITNTEKHIEPINTETQQEPKKKRLVFVRFSTLPTAYIFDAQDIELNLGDLVVVGTEAGIAIAKVLGYTTEEDASGLEEIKPILRKLTDADREKYDQIKIKEKECFAFCHERIIARELPMKLTKVEQSFDGNKITFYFIADNRVDFRELLKDLVEMYKTRIELRQIGARQEAGMLGGIGSCGKELCCATYLTSFQRISVKMAKNQNMTLNPSKISGLCGKLKCCLAYEKESYANLIENLPKPGKTVYTDQGEVTVVSINVINQTFVAKLADRRFIKAKVSDILSREEYLQVGEQKANEHTRLKDEVLEEIPVGEKLPAEHTDTDATKQKKRRSSRHRYSKKKRRNPS